jgi:hypothetical protein
MGKFEKTTTNIACPYFIISKPISLLGFWEDYMQNLFVVRIPQYKVMIILKKRKFGVS